MAAENSLTIVHLYSDVMNIYGDWGNIATLAYRARRRGLAVEISSVGVGDSIDPDRADIIFFGGGQDVGQEIVAADLPRLKPILQPLVEDGAALLSICGGYQLLGQSYTTAAGQRLEGLGILPVDTIAGSTRMMHNVVVAINPQLDIDRSAASTLVGFENHSGKTQLQTGALSLGRVLKGSGNNGQDNTEGVVYKHAVGSYLHGSCLPKNPHLADWLLQKAIDRKFGHVALSPLDDQLEWQAHRLAVGLKA